AQKRASDPSYLNNHSEFLKFTEEIAKITEENNKLESDLKKLSEHSEPETTEQEKAEISQHEMIVKYIEEAEIIRKKI
ncbi:hypothetical protein PMAYCL1PPCAC_11453, partial [Pristionchus mayeri]